jgi:cytochrome b6-f complex iron-sulfur subunit
MATRREVLAAAAATVTLPMLDSALGQMRSASAAAPATTPARGANTAVPEEKAGWITTKLKVADTKDGEYTAVPDHSIVLVRNGKEINALSNRCTHRFCAMPPKAGDKILTCPCHGSQFKADGTVAKGPATVALANFAIRTNTDGFIEIDPGTKPKKEDKEFKIEAA